MTHLNSQNRLCSSDLVEHFGLAVPEPQQPGEGDERSVPLTGEAVGLDEIQQRLGQDVLEGLLGIDAPDDDLRGGGAGAAVGCIPRISRSSRRTSASRLVPSEVSSRAWSVQTWSGQTWSARRGVGQSWSRDRQQHAQRVVQAGHLARSKTFAGEHDGREIERAQSRGEHDGLWCRKQLPHDGGRVVEHEAARPRRGVGLEGVEEPAPEARRGLPLTARARRCSPSGSRSSTAGSESGSNARGRDSPRPRGPFQPSTGPGRPARRGRLPPVSGPG